MVQFGGRDSSSLNSDHIDIFVYLCRTIYCSSYFYTIFVTNLLFVCVYGKFGWFFPFTFVSLIFFLCVCTGSLADFFPSLLISGWLATIIMPIFLMLYLFCNHFLLLFQLSCVIACMYIMMATLWLSNKNIKCNSIAATTIIVVNDCNTNIINSNGNNNNNDDDDDDNDGNNNDIKI